MILERLQLMLYYSNLTGWQFYNYQFLLRKIARRQRHYGNSKVHQLCNSPFLSEKKRVSSGTTATRQDGNTMINIFFTKESSAAAIAAIQRMENLVQERQAYIVLSVVLLIVLTF